MFSPFKYKCLKFVFVYYFYYLKYISWKSLQFRTGSYLILYRICSFFLKLMSIFQYQWKIFSKHRFF